MRPNPSCPCMTSTVAYASPLTAQTGLAFTKFRFTATCWRSKFLYRISSI